MVKEALLDSTNSASVSSYYNSKAMLRRKRLKFLCTIPRMLMICLTVTTFIYLTRKNYHQNRHGRMRASNEHEKEVTSVLKHINTIFSLTSREQDMVKEALLDSTNSASVSSYYNSKAMLRGRSFHPKIPYEAKLTFNEFYNSIHLPILTQEGIGRLGNQMCEYATLFAYGRLYNATVLLHPQMKEKLQFFKHISMPDMSVSGLSFSYFENWFGVSKNWELLPAGYFGPKLLYFEGYPCELSYINEIKEEINKEFTFNEDYKNYADRFLSTLKRRRDLNGSVTFIGFHIRRADYGDHFKNFYGGDLPEETYFRNAMKYYRQRHSFVLFVVASDDKEFAKEYFAPETDVEITPDETNEGQDMSILTACNHSIMTVGSYGFWASFLTGGKVLYPKTKTKIFYQFSLNSFKAAKLDNFIEIA